jgi:hypothetical protein
MFLESAVAPIILFMVFLVLLEANNPMGKFHERPSRKSVREFDRVIGFLFDVTDELRRDRPFDESNLFLCKPLWEFDHEFVVRYLPEKVPKHSRVGFRGRIFSPKLLKVSIDFDREEAHMAN